MSKYLLIKLASLISKHFLLIKLGYGMEEILDLKSLML